MVFYSSAEEKIKPEHKNDFDSDKSTKYKMDAITAKYAKKARARGWDGTLLTPEEKELCALESDQKRGWLDKEDEPRLLELQKLLKK